MYSDGFGYFPILACILGISALVGMRLAIGGVASENNIMTAIGLTMVAIPALISGGVAIAVGIGGATLTGMSEGLYNGLMISSAAIAILGTFASSVYSAFNIKSISGIGKYGDCYGMRFQTGASKTRVLSFYTHGHKVTGGIKCIGEWNWQPQKWNPMVNKTAGTITR